MKALQVISIKENDTLMVKLFDMAGIHHVWLSSFRINNHKAEYSGSGWYTAEELKTIILTGIDKLQAAYDSWRGINL
jgi:hypothetical protein